MPYTVDFINVSTVGLETSPVAAALAGLRANEARKRRPPSKALPRSRGTAAVATASARSPSTASTRPTRGSRAIASAGTHSSGLSGPHDRLRVNAIVG